MHDLVDFSLINSSRDSHCLRFGILKRIKQSPFPSNNSVFIDWFKKQMHKTNIRVTEIGNQRLQPSESLSQTAGSNANFSHPMLCHVSLITSAITSAVECRLSAETYEAYYPSELCTHECNRNGSFIWPGRNFGGHAVLTASAVLLLHNPCSPKLSTYFFQG